MPSSASATAFETAAPTTEDVAHARTRAACGVPHVEACAEVTWSEWPEVTWGASCGAHQAGAWRQDAMWMRGGSRRPQWDGSFRSRVTAPPSSRRRDARVVQVCEHSERRCRVYGRGTGSVQCPVGRRGGGIHWPDRTGLGRRSAELSLPWPVRTRLTGL
eukprot:4610156-Prymnesium_polylepis.2